MRTLSVILLALLSHVESFSMSGVPRLPHASSTTSRLTAAPTDDNMRLLEEPTTSSLSRRSLLTTVGQQSLLVSMWMTLAASSSEAASVSDAQVTDRIYMDVKGVALDQPPQRIVIGLFGKDAPEAVQMLKSLVTQEGLQADCKPKEIRTLQKEQLEANKVYNACVEGQQQQGQGVNYDLSTIWRVIRDERIDVGAVSGRFVARQFPTWQGSNDFTHDAPGVVSVRKGNDSGFGFTIYPGGGGGGGDASSLDASHLVVGRVLEGMAVVESLNQVPVVTSKFASQAELPTAPNRSCRYGGGQLYCSEYKPLQKLSIVSTGVL